MAILSDAAYILEEKKKQSVNGGYSVCMWIEHGCVTIQMNSSYRAVLSRGTVQGGSNFSVCG